MPNKSVDKKHIPVRTCVICRQKDDMHKLLGFYLLEREIVFDINRVVQKRKMYVCHTEDCCGSLDKWLKKFLKRHVSKK